MFIVSSKLYQYHDHLETLSKITNTTKNLKSKMSKLYNSKAIKGSNSAKKRISTTPVQIISQPVENMQNTIEMQTPVELEISDQ
jgi:predicted RNA-binding protein